ncbi:MAG: 6-bladed beta-propeller, partial [Desulfuromonadales bacterium]|nr:6-bladed beta-propeller [Desulfuromonadales bacterium]
AQAPSADTPLATAEPVVLRGDIPEEFRPRNSQGKAEIDSGPGMGPVRIRHVSFDSAGNIYLVSGETSKIYVYGPDESFLFSFGEKGGTPRKLSQPRGLASDENRRLIYVADYMRHSILVFNMAGRYLFEFGGRGAGPGWFNFPSDIAINRQGQVIVSDLFNQRVQVLQIDYAESFPLFQSPRVAAPAAEEAETGEDRPAPDDRPGNPEVDADGEGGGVDPAESPAPAELAPAEAAPREIGPTAVEAPAEAEAPAEEVIVTETIGNALPPAHAEEALQEPVPAPAAPLTDHEEGSQALRNWAQAWSAQDVAGYLASYSIYFRPEGELSRRAWEEQRRQRLLKPKWIKVELKDIRILPRDGGVQVELLQEYRSSHFQERTRKRLDLIEENGEWRIVAEKTIP